MDDGNSNIFETGNSVDQRKPDGTGDGLPGTGGGTTGRIDPSIAAAAAGIGAGNPGGGGTTGNTRGRHRNDCNCPKCIAKRQAAGSVTGLADPAEPKAEKSQAIRATFIEKSLNVLHMCAATVLKAPELELDDDDAKKLGEGVAGVLAFYKVKMTRKQEAYALLMEAAAQVYPPMVVSLYIRKKFEAEEARKRNPQPMRPVAAATPPPPQQQQRGPVVVPGPGFDPLNVKLDP